jgi:hypothetical protein
MNQKNNCMYFQEGKMYIFAIGYLFFDWAEKYYYFSTIIFQLTENEY